jgi:hypothetical protein
MAFLFNKDNSDVKIGLRELTVLLDELRLPISLVFTPINLEQEKEKFFDSDNYNPQFKYRKIKNSNSEVFKRIQNITEVSDVDPRISQFYLELIKAKIDTTQMMEKVGDNDAITELSYAKYGEVTPELFRNATRILKGQTLQFKLLNEDMLKTQKYLNFDEIKKAFDAVFVELGLDGWVAEKSQNIARNGAKLGVKSKRVYLYGDIKKRSYELRKTIIHEVGTHALRAVNGEKSGYSAFSKANVPSYLLAEEGLAMYNEESMGVLTRKDLKNRAAMVWAIYVGEKMSFRQLYNCLLALFPKKQAFDLTYRVKRGLGDTSKPGIYSKDLVYLRGFLRVRRKIMAEPAIYDMLYAGKIGFDKIEWVEEGLLAKPKIVPTKKQFEEIFKKIGI